MTKQQLLDILRQYRQLIDDEEAVKVKEIYPIWKENVAYALNARVTYKNILYKCTTAHTSQADWKPVNVPALWTAIDETHAGTLADPIPAVAGMEYIKGKYYIENGTKYIMDRAGMEDGQTVTLQYTPSQLVGIYFSVAE